MGEMAFRLAMVRGLFLTSGALGLTIRAYEEEKNAKERHSQTTSLGGG